MNNPQKTKLLRGYLKLADKVMHPENNTVKWADFERFTKYHERLLDKLTIRDKHGRFIK